MKKIAIILIALLMACAACSKQPDAPVSTTTTEAPTTTQLAGTTMPSPQIVGTVSSEPMGNDIGDYGKYRPMYYSIAISYVELVGREAFLEWEATRRETEEFESECIAVSFVKHFNISKEDFNHANEARRKLLAKRGDKPEDSPRYELYDVDLIYTFDNEKINEFFLWENGPYDY